VVLVDDLALVLVTVVAVFVSIVPAGSAATAVVRRWAPRLDPTPERVAVVRLRLLRQRRLFLVLLVLVVWVPLVGAALLSTGPDALGWWQSTSGWSGRLGVYLLPLCFTVAVFLTETATAVGRSAGGVLVVSLRRRPRASEMVPRYALIMFGVLVMTVAAIAATALLRLRGLGSPAPADPAALEIRMADAMDGRLFAWAAFVGAAVTVALVAATVRLVCMRRALRPASTVGQLESSDADAALDVALRVRSARYVIGAGLATTGTFAVLACESLRAAANLLDGAYTGSFWADHGNTVGGLLMVTGAVGWLLVANPPWRERVPAAGAVTGRTA
jgi:hypothetical protein